MGDAAENARAESRRIVEELSALEASESIDETDILRLSRKIDGASMSAALAPMCRKRLGTLRKRLKHISKNTDKQAVEFARVRVFEAVSEAAQEGRRYCTVILDGLNAKALQRAAQSSSQEVAVLAIGSTTDCHIHCVAVVPKSCQEVGFTADRWLGTTLDSLGGRGGG